MEKDAVELSADESAAVEAIIDVVSLGKSSSRKRFSEISSGRSCSSRSRSRCNVFRRAAVRKDAVELEVLETAAVEVVIDAAS